MNATQDLELMPRKSVESGPRRWADMLVVGSLNVDLVTSVAHRPQPGETVLGTDLCIYPGGKGANQAVAGARLGGTVQMLGNVGDDHHGVLLRQALSASGVHDSLVRTLPGTPSGVALITVTPDGENSIIVSPGANARLQPADVDAAVPAMRGLGALLLQLESPLHTVEYAAAMAAQSGTRVVLNLAPPAGLAAATMRGLDPLVVNRHEARFLLGAIPETPQQAVEASKQLLQLGPASAVITLGADGATFADRSSFGHIRAPDARVADTTGAGDAFTAALTLALVRGGTLKAATVQATRAGAKAVEAHGAQQSFPATPEVDPEVQ